MTYFEFQKHFPTEEDAINFIASVNINNRVTVTVSRDSLLKQLGNGAYEPRKLKREKVKAHVEREH